MSLLAPMSRMMPFSPASFRMMKPTPVASCSSLQIGGVHTCTGVEVGGDLAQLVVADDAGEVGVCAQPGVATAWFEPLPPGPMSKSAPTSVSPKRGMREVRNVMPTAKLPTIVMIGFVIVRFLVSAASGRDGLRGIVSSIDDGDEDAGIEMRPFHGGGQLKSVAAQPHFRILDGTAINQIGSLIHVHDSAAARHAQQPSRIRIGQPRLESASAIGNQRIGLFFDGGKRRRAVKSSCSRFGANALTT